MAIEIVYATENLVPSFYTCLGHVAREKIYIEMIEPPTYESVLEFQKKLIANNWPLYYAVAGEEVVGWADLTPVSNPRLSHRGFLGMGIIKDYRGQGIGRQLLQACLVHAPKIGLEKVELAVYTENIRAIKLYEKMGFEREGLIKHFRKLENKYYDCLNMGKFL